MSVFLDRLAHSWRMIRAHRYLYRWVSRAHGHKHRPGALVCNWCLDEILYWAPVLVAGQEYAR